MSDISTRMVTALFRFTRRSTIHGFNHIAQARTSQRRLFWLFISISATIGFFINMKSLLDKYWQNPVLTNLYHDQKAFSFPDFTFCQMNPLYFPPKGTRERKELEDYLDTRPEKVLVSDFLYLQKKAVLTHPKWSSIISCDFNGNTCDESHFDLIPNFPYLSCYFLNQTKLARGKSLYSKAQLSNPSFTMVVYQSLTFPKKYQIDPHDQLSLPAGIVLMLHEPNTFPHIGYNTLVINGGTRIELKITEVNHLASLGTCRKENLKIQYYNFFNNQTMEFVERYNDCIIRKIQKTLVKTLNCTFFQVNTLAEHSNLRFCGADELRSTNLDTDYESCSSDPCTHTNIGKVIAHSQFPAVEQRYTHRNWLAKLAELEKLEMKQFNASDLAKKALINPGNLTCREAHKKELVDKLNVKFIEQNFLMFKIVPFSRYIDIVVEEEEYPLSRLLSDMGGCIGLWIGASLITFFECIDLILDIIDSARVKKMGQESNDESEEDKNITKTLLKNHTAQTYILGGQPLWDTDSEVDWLKSKYQGVKDIPPTPPFYHENVKKANRQQGLDNIQVYALIKLKKDLNNQNNHFSEDDIIHVRENMFPKYEDII